MLLTLWRRPIRLKQMIFPPDMRVLLKRLCLFVLIFGIACLWPLLFAEDKPGLTAAQLLQPGQPGYTVTLNRYAPEDWNGGYGHYDLSFIAPPNQMIRCKLGEEQLDCKEITLSYGATDGDLSPARVHLYTGARSDHLPVERLTIHDSLQPEDFNAFMAWFTHDFSLYAQDRKDCYEFSVTDENYAVYSLQDKRNCLTAAIHMALKIPGIRDAQLNPHAGLVERLMMGMNLN